MRLIKLLVLLLLCSCVTSNKVQDYLAEEKEQPAAEAIIADWLEQHQEWYAARAARDFPRKDSVIIKTDTVLVHTTIPGNTTPCPEAAPCPEVASFRTGRPYPPKIERPDVSFFEKTISEKEQQLQESAAKLKEVQQREKVLQATLATEQQSHQKTRVQRDYYMELNRKKLWTLIAMGVFALLYIVFKVAANRVRTT